MWKILLVQEAAAGGTARHILDLSGGLIRSGHSVHVVYSPRRADTTFEAALKDLVGVPTAVVDMRRSPHIADVRAITSIRNYLARHGPFDIIHGHSSKGGALARLAAVDVDVGRVYTPHCLRTLEPTLSPPLRFAYTAVENVLARFTDAVIAVSQEEYDHAMRIGIPKQKLHKVVNGITWSSKLSRQEIRSLIGLKDDDVCIGFIGRLVRQKAPERLIEAFGRLVPKISRAKLVVIGDGALKAQLVARAETLGVARQIKWLAEATGPAMMPAFDIFTLPSRYEGMPYVLLEAAVTGSPIIATAVGGVSTVVSADRNGYIVPNWDLEQFVDRLVQLVVDAELREEMGRASTEIGRVFTVERMLEGTIEVYRGVLERRPANITNRRTFWGRGRLSRISRQTRSRDRL